VTSRLGTVKSFTVYLPAALFQFEAFTREAFPFLAISVNFWCNNVYLRAEVTTRTKQRRPFYCFHTLCSYRFSGWRPSVTAKTGRRATTATPGLIPTLQENMEPMDLEVSHVFFSLACTHHRGLSQKWTCLPSRKCKDGLKCF
jgi:hypothetical protein